MDRALGTTHETSLRMALLLEALGNKGMTANMLAALDFITVYGHDFNITDKNLHGNGIYRFGEFTLRREMVRNALKPLVTQGLVTVQTLNHGFVYVLSDNGHDFSSEFESDYADNYRLSAELVVNALGKVSEREVIGIVNQKAVQSIQRSQ